MSGQWEVVGKTKQKSNGKPVKKLTKNEKKKFVENAPKVEDILPLSQVKTLYTALDNNKENRKPQMKEVSNNKEPENKKQTKKQQEKKKEPIKEKVPPPKNVESAVKLIKVDELNNEIKIGQARFPETPLVWLKGLAVYLNSKLYVDHSPTFSGKVVEYPSNLLPGEIRDLLRRAIKEAGEPVALPFFEWCLTSMANDMTRGTSTGLGYKMLLQLLAFQNPHLTTSAIPKATELLNSYQNRQPIGLSILWAVGLGGVKDLAIGLNIWRCVMLSYIEMRNYSNYVTEYARDLFSHKAAARTALTQEQLLGILDVIFNPKFNISNTVRQELAASLQKHVLGTETKKRLPYMFQPLLERLHPSSHDNLKSELFMYLNNCLQNETECFTTWRQVYTQTIPQSALLLKYISKTWKIDPKSRICKQLRATLCTFITTNEELVKSKHKEEGLLECKKICEDLARKMTVKSSFPWKTGCFILMAAIGILLSYDVRKNGTFYKSNVGRFLGDVGAITFAERSWTSVKLLSNKSYQWAEGNLPGYQAMVIEKLQPAVQLCSEKGIIAANYLLFVYENMKHYVEESTPVFTSWVNHYAPGLLEMIKQYSSLFLEGVIYYSAVMWNCFIEYSQLAIQWIQNNVFVGSLSPENIQRFSMEAFNTTQIYALWTYDWVCQKVQTLSKIQ